MDNWLEEAGTITSEVWEKLDHITSIESPRVSGNIINPSIYCEEEDGTTI